MALSDKWCQSMTPSLALSQVEAQQMQSLSSMSIHVLQCVFHVEKQFCTHRFFLKYEQTFTEKIAHALLLILMREVCLQRSMMLSKYSR